ncbi:MAG: tyrosine--tRNA ligase [Candidatus Acetothermia bacterium]
MSNRWKSELDLLRRGAADIIPEDELKKKLELAEKEDRQLRVKLGVDPSSPDLTLGHGVVLRKLRHFQDLGHLAVLVVGDFTRRIGDPSGKTKTREMMSLEEIQSNMADYEQQAFRILDPELTEFRYNSEWLGKLTFEDIIELSSKYTVSRMLEREDFRNRYEQNQPISIMEFLYPLAQAYDSIAIDADVELGGTDQRFNLLIGRQIQREYGQPPQIILTVPLLEGTDGVHAMSQTRGNYIGLNEKPKDVYGKIMAVPDHLMDKYFGLLTDLNPDQFDDLHPKKKKKRLAHQIVANIYSSVEADHAQKEFEKVFEDGEQPSEMEEIVLYEDDVKDDGTIWIVDLLEKTDFVSSRSQARRLIDQGGVRLDREKVETINCDPRIEDDVVLQVGKTKYARIIPDY